MNFSKTAKETGVGRTSIHRYHAKHWDEYIARRFDVRASSSDIDQVAIDQVKLDMNVLQAKLKLFTDVTGEAIELVRERILKKSIKDRDLIQFINVSSQYIFQKKSPLGDGPLSDDIKTRKQQFIQNNIVNHKTTIINQKDKQK